VLFVAVVVAAVVVVTVDVVAVPTLTETPQRWGT
jgi:hypothetical protein